MLREKKKMEGQPMKPDFKMNEDTETLNYKATIHKLWCLSMSLHAWEKYFLMENLYVLLGSGEKVDDKKKRDTKYWK